MQLSQSVLTDCMVWTGATARKGYGIRRHNGKLVSESRQRRRQARAAQ